MAATFDETLPTAKDRIRHLVGDIDMANPLRQDEIYNALIAQYSETEATALMAEALAAEYSQLPVRFSDDGTMVDWTDRAKTWLELAKRMRQALAEITTAGLAVYKVIKPQSYYELEDDCEYKRPEWVSGPGWQTRY